MAKDIVPKNIDEAVKNMEISLEEFATGVAKISRGMEILFQSRLKESTVIMLVAKASGVSQGIVEKVLEVLPLLERKFLKVEKK